MTAELRSAGSVLWGFDKHGMKKGLDETQNSGLKSPTSGSEH